VLTVYQGIHLAIKPACFLNSLRLAMFLPQSLKTGVITARYIPEE
jgi:hypothetical protein